MARKHPRAAAVLIVEATDFPSTRLIRFVHLLTSFKGRNLPPAFLEALLGRGGYIRLGRPAAPWCVQPFRSVLAVHLRHSATFIELARHQLFGPGLMGPRRRFFLPRADYLRHPLRWRSGRRDTPISCPSLHAAWRRCSVARGACIAGRWRIRGAFQKRMPGLAGQITVVKETRPR